MRETENFRTIGQQAFANGEPCIPAASAAVQAAIADLPVGGGAVQIMRDWTKGWNEASMAAAFAEIGIER